MCQYFDFTIQMWCFLKKPFFVKTFYRENDVLLNVTSRSRLILVVCSVYIIRTNLTTASYNASVRNVYMDKDT
jgi:hypothetical protein